MSLTTTGRELQFRLLGQLAVQSEDGLIDLGSPKQRAVLAVLLLSANEIVPTDRIIEMVWGDDAPRTAEHSVQIYVSELRKALSSGAPSQLIDTRPPGYLINVSPDSIDTMRFERLVRDGLSEVRSGNQDRGHPKLEEALAMWNSEPLADFAYADFVQGFVRSLNELRSDALETVAALELERGAPEKAREAARKAIEADPLREEPRRVMMVALYRDGRQAEALRHFSEYRSILGEEMGIEPSETLRRLEEQVLLQDPVLQHRPLPDAQVNPYRGLRAFTEDDGDVYFGREALVLEVLERLETGQGFVSIVGPSGSGKSSAARAGVIPVLRSRGFEVEVIQPGSRPLWQLAGALERGASGSRASLRRRFESDPQSLGEVVKRPLVLILDQFEELFTLAQPDAAVRFSELLSNAVRDRSVPLKVVVTLRADYYDRPLSMPALAGVFSESVVSVKPMSPQEIESAIVEPARAAGFTVEPALIAQLVTDMADNPGALPLLQFTLFELFERASGELTLEGYDRLGGINGALTGGADDLLSVLDAPGRELAEQLMMRMVQKGRALSTSRSVLVRDLLDLSKDSVVLQRVLEAFGSRRLLTFDRDASGAATVEMAHEYLITEWPQMETWLIDHSLDLDRLYVLEMATADWLDGGRSNDYLLRGDRLAVYEEWQSATTLSLTTAETNFLESSVALRDREEKIEAEREAHESTLQQRAKRRLWYFGGAVAALAAALTLLVITLIPDPPPDVVASYCCRGESGFGTGIARGLDAGTESTGLSLVELGDQPPNVDLLFEYAARGTGLILTDGTLDSESALKLVEENASLIVGYMECSGIDVTHPRVWCIETANHEMGFLAGGVAGLATDTHRVGIVLGANAVNMPAFHAGFMQGVTVTNSEAIVDAVYLSNVWPYGDSSGFTSPALGYLAATEMYQRGADVVFAAAGWSNKGVHEAAVDFSSTAGIHVWSIGADDDEWLFYNEKWWPDWIDETAAASLSDRSPRLQEHILTSIEKRTDVGIALLMEAYARGQAVDHLELSIANGAIGYTTSGDQMVPFEAEIDRLAADIAEGSVIIESKPQNRAPMLPEWLGMQP